MQRPSDDSERSRVTLFNHTKLPLQYTVYLTFYVFLSHLVISFDFVSNIILPILTKVNARDIFRVHHLNFRGV